MSDRSFHSSTTRIRTGLLVAALLTSGFAGCTPSPVEYMQQAKASRAKHDYQSAIIQLKNILAQQPDHAEARFLLGKSFTETNDYASAEIELRRAQQLQYEPARVVAALAAVLASKGEYQKVLDELNAFQQEQEGGLPPELLTLQGSARLALGRQDAASSFEAALEKSPALADAYLGLARVAAAAGKLDEALKQIDRALEKSPNSVEAWLFKGDIVGSKPAADEAEKAYRRAVELSPNDAQPHLRLAGLYSGMGKLDAAQVEIDTVRKANPKNPEAQYQQAVVHLKKGNYAAADEVIQQVLKVAPDNVKSVLVAGAAAHFLGKTEVADKSLRAYLKWFPDDGYARKLLAANLLRANQPAQALEAVSPLLPAGRDAHALVIAGNAALQNKEPVKASEYLARAVALAPTNAALRAELGVSRLAAGDVQHGLADLESATQLPGSSPSVDMALISTYLNRKEYDKALAAIATLEKKNSADPAVFTLRGIALLGNETPAEARTNFEKALALQPDYFPAVSNLARQDLKEKNYDAARGRFVKLLEKKPANLQAMLALAEIAAIAGDGKEQLEWLQKAVKAAPTAVQPHIALSNYYREKNELQKALSIAREAQGANPDNPEALNLLGSLQVALGDRQDALATYGTLVRVAPKSPLARYSLALLQSDARNAEGARESLVKALELQPGYAEAEVALAVLETQTGRYAEALKLAQKVRSRDPKSPLGLVMEGDIRMMQKDYNAASRAYDAALHVAKTPALFIKAHDALVRGGKTKEADARAVQWLKDQPADKSLQFYLADMEMRTGRSQLAIEHYQALLQQEPDNIVALNNLATLYQKENDSRDLSTAEQAYKLKPGHPAVLDTLAWIVLQRGDFKRAMPLLQEAVAKSPKSGTLRYHLAAGYAKSGDKAKARETLDALLVSDEPFPQRADAIALQAQL